MFAFFSLVSTIVPSNREWGQMFQQEKKHQSQQTFTNIWFFFGYLIRFSTKSKWENENGGEKYGLLTEKKPEIERNQKKNNSNKMNETFPLGQTIIILCCYIHFEIKIELFNEKNEKKNDCHVWKKQMMKWENFFAILNFEI